MIKEISLYLHIPFCERKCHYCDFLSGPAPDETREAYVKALCGELRREGERYEHRAVDTVFIGGGTPSILAAAQLEQLMEATREAFVIRPEAEISMEANPGSADERKLRTWQKAGINRLSIGLQSADDEELKRLGRIHTRKDFLRTWEAARTAGFTNLNIDIMSALPGQNMASYERTLEEVLRLKPEHISAYSLIIEEGTLFYQWFGPEGVYTDSRQKEMLLPDEEEDRLMYELTGTMLEAGGYQRYEISNYSLPGRECRHNIGYWTGKEYLGLGLGASSYMDHQRFARERELSVYLEKTAAGQDTGIEYQVLSKNEEMEEFLFLGLRMMMGVSADTFLTRFGVSMRERYGRQIEELVGKGLLEWRRDGRLALTKFGIDVSNLVFGEFLS